MGAQYSRSRAYVNNVVQAGIDVAVSQVFSRATQISGTQILELEGCDYAKISNIEMKQMSVVVNKDAVQQLSDTTLQTNVNAAVKNAAEALAKGGIGLEGTDAEAVVNMFIDVGQKITSAASAVFSTNVDMRQTMRCKNSAHIDVSVIEFTQRVQVVSEAVVQQVALNQAMIDIIEKIDNDASAKSVGYDPMGIFGIAAIAVVIALVLGVGGGAMAGFNLFKNIIGSRYFWMGTLGLLGAASAVALTGEIVGFWPKQGDALDKPDQAAKHKKINTAVKAISGVSLGLCLTGLGVLIFFQVRAK
jgi:hypothetical protein